MADEDGESEDDGIEDMGAPPVVPGMRVWTDPSGNEPVTADERTRFGIPATPPPRPMPPTPPREVVEGEWRDSRPDPAVAVITALVAKFPDFNPEWPEKIADRWFAGFEQLMKAGLK